MPAESRAGGHPYRQECKSWWTDRWFSARTPWILSEINPDPFRQLFTDLEPIS
jgi:hypothetical protein